MIDWKTVLDVKWQPFDNAQKVQQADLLNDVYVEALRRLAPETGAYVNEVRLPRTYMNFEKY